MERWKRHKALYLWEKRQGSRSIFLIVIMMALFVQVAAQHNTDRIADLITQLKSPNEFFRVTATEALARIGPEAIPALTEALKDQSADVRRNAAEALGEMGPEAKQAIPALTEVLQDANVLTRVHAANAIKRLKSV